MSGAGPSSTSSAVLAEEQRRCQRAFWEYCVANRRTIQLADPRLYARVNHVIMERIRCALGYPDRVALSRSEQRLIDMNISMLSGEWDTLSMAGDAVEASPLVSTLPPDQEPESELQPFYSAHSRIVLDEDQLQDEPGSGRGELLLDPQAEVLPRLRVLFEQLAIGGQPVLEEGRQASFSGNTEAEQFRVLGATHSHTETECTLKMGNIRIAVIFIPWRDQALLINTSTGRLRLTSKKPDGPDGPGALDIWPRRSTTLEPGCWALQNSGDRLGLQLRPCRYRLVLEVETKKRTAGPAPPSKAARVIAGQGRGRDSAPDLAPEETGKGLVRRALPGDIDRLASFGVPLGHTLFMIDRATGEVECSIKRLDSWLVEREYGVLFKAAWRKGAQSQLVIVKMHKPEGNNAVRQAIERWRREVKVHRNLQHERIASLVAFDARLLMLAVELKDAYDLGSRYWCYARATRRAGFFKGTLDDAYTICADISSALSYLETKNVIHGDIKALNILYSRQNGATLIDFGLGQFVEERITQTGGSPWYKEPVAQNESEEISGNIFSLGIVMLYVMGELPLPEREPGWGIYNASIGDPEAVKLRDIWFTKIKAKGEELQMLLPTLRSGKEAKLRGLVCKMLAKTRNRISARDLAKEMGQEQ